MKIIREIKQHTVSALFYLLKHFVLRSVLLVILGTALLIVSAKIEIPIEPVPITMQSLAVLFIGMTFGWQLGGVTIFVYLLEGFIGLPVFSTAVSGPIAFSYPMIGYFIGMFPATMLSGYLIESGWGSSTFKAGLAALIGMIVFYTVGLVCLADVTGWELALDFGLYPSLFVEFLKIIFLAFLIPVIWRVSNQIRSDSMRISKDRLF